MLYRGEYSQWRERFMNYLEEQTDGEAMINSIQNGDHPLPVIAQVSLAGTAPNAPPTLKDPQFWTAEEKKNRKIDRLARSLLIQGLPNDIYSLIDSNDTAKDFMVMLLKGRWWISEYGEKDRKAAIFYNEMEKPYGTLMRHTNENLWIVNINALYNILKQNQGDVNEAIGYKKKAVMFQSESEGSDDKDISDLKKITALLAKAFNRKKYYAKPTNNNLRTSSASSSANKKPEYVKSEEKKEDKKVDEKKRDMSKVKCYNCKKEGHFAKYCKKAKVKDYNYYKTKMLLAKKDSDEQLLLAEDQAWMESSSDSDQEINANMVFMAKMENVFSDSEESSSSAEENHAEGYTPMFLTHSNEALEIEKFKRARENKIEFAYDYGNLNASSESSENAISDSENQSENDCHEVEKGCDNLENSNVIAPGMFKINVSQSVSPISAYKPSCASNNVENKTKRKRRKRTSSKQNDKQVNNDVLRANRDFVHFSDLDTVSSVRRPKHSGVIWKKKGSSNTSNVDLSSVSYSKLNKDVKRYSRKDLLSYCPDLSLDHQFGMFKAYGRVNRATFGKNLWKVVWNGSLWQINDFAVIAAMGCCYWINDDQCKDLLTGDRSLNLYTIALNEIASNSSAGLTAKGFFSHILAVALRILSSLIDEASEGHHSFIKTNQVRSSTSRFTRVRTDNGTDVVIFSMIYGNVGKLRQNGDIGVFVGYSKEYDAFRFYNKRNSKDSRERIEPANVAEALKDADWVSAMQDELDQFARLKSKYISSIFLKRFGMENCDTVPTPMVEQAKLKLDLVGKPVESCLWYPKDSGFDLTAYSDADHAGCHLDRKSTSGSVQFLGDKLVCWSSKKQNCVSISTAESEYVAVSGCCAQVLWMRTQLTDYGFFFDKYDLPCSKSAIANLCNP
ncbi:integrase, catalytic region, zinc finger, CCHC-type containing protein [Tanacetum coccineum]|uniref:Integrase, catalytic region, zinc finger, CCHC-type containing protein n=1 Tax=Tanacetum coccineum TaxID=301880 RepID=A0ABQ5D6K2_9ASTR